MINRPTIVLSVSNQLFASFLEDFLLKKGFVISKTIRQPDLFDPIVLCDDVFAAPPGNTVVFLRSGRKGISLHRFAGILSETSTREELIECLESIMLGKRFVSPRLENREVNEVTGESLSTREAELLALYGKGYTMVEIADYLNISKNTVNNHLARIRKKMNLRGPNSLVRFSQSIREVQSGF